tara:strand:+ start:86 stop:550 length:465 start_codon:yes stop_codon:yes gene_type:complete
MKNIKKYTDFSINEEDGFRKNFMDRVYNYGKAQAASNYTGNSEDDAILRTLGNIIAKVAQIGGAGIKKDFDIDWADGYSDEDLLKNRKGIVDQWKTKKAIKSTNSDSEAESVFNEFDRKGKARFGKDFDMFRPKNDTEKAWSDYAIDIMKLYSK